MFWYQVHLILTLKDILFDSPSHNHVVMNIYRMMSSEDIAEKSWPRMQIKKLSYSVKHILVNKCS